MRNSSMRTPLRHLHSDLRAVARDAEDLLKATADATGKQVEEARTRTRKTLDRALDNLNERKVRRKVRKAVRETDDYVRDHSWSVIGVAAGVALLVGLCMRRG